MTTPLRAIFLAQFVRMLMVGDASAESIICAQPFVASGEGLEIDVLPIVPIAEAASEGLVINCPWPAEGIFHFDGNELVLTLGGGRIGTVVGSYRPEVMLERVGIQTRVEVEFLVDEILILDPRVPLSDVIELFQIDADTYELVEGPVAFGDALDEFLEGFRSMQLGGASHSISPAGSIQRLLTTMVDIAWPSSWMRVNLESFPTGAQVFLGDEPIGNTASVLSIRADRMRSLRMVGPNGSDCSYDAANTSELLDGSGISVSCVFTN